MRRTFVDDQFDEWEAFVTAGQPGGKDAARFMFVCTSSPDRPPRSVHAAGGDPAAAERELAGMDEADLLQLFSASEPIP